MSDLRDQVTEALRAGRCCTGHIPRIADAVARRIEPEIERLTRRAENAEDRARKGESAYGRLKSERDDLEAQRDRWRKRAEQAEAEANRMDELLIAERAVTRRYQLRAHHAEALLRELADDKCDHPTTEPCPHDCAKELLAALDRPETADDATVRDATTPQDWTTEETPNA